MPNKKFPSNQPFPSDDYPEMERDVMQERLRQAKFCTNVVLGSAIVSAFIPIFGIVLLFFGKVTEGSVVTAGGLTSNIVSVRLLKFTKETNDRLDRLAKEFKDDD